MLISESPLSNRTKSTLLNLGFNTVADVFNVGNNLFKMRNVGIKIFTEIALFYNEKCNNVSKTCIYYQINGKKCKKTGKALEEEIAIARLKKLKVERITVECL